MGSVYALTGSSAVTILMAGWVLAQTGDALAEQTGHGASFGGVALVAASTSLPELSTTLGAVRRGNYQMAVSNILGTNCLEVALFFLADAMYRGGPILAAVDRSAGLSATVLYQSAPVRMVRRTTGEASASVGSSGMPWCPDEHPLLASVVTIFRDFSNQRGAVPFSALRKSRKGQQIGGGGRREVCTALPNLPWHASEQSGAAVGLSSWSPDA